MGKDGPKGLRHPQMDMLTVQVRTLPGPPKPTTKGPPNSNSEQALPAVRAAEVVGTTFTELEALSRVLDLSPFPFLCGWETRAMG